MSEAVEKAQAAYDAADREYMSAAWSNANSGDGSGAQEARRESLLESLRDARDRCKSQLEEAKHQAAADGDQA
ncbi:hypothetical protein HA052_04470 [Chromobacterium haemolyticum]|uniref:DUF4398 domain-containing protein n=1 Tax=Chromobacterium fluminis TaxID=3044269 RepID=A0ABX0L0X2_9NEIS|nr:hypothetical protein [Chromobacterium haemolyticum]NHR04445.1 hypothetical protein [Chromobacterium haemolyticum]